MPMSNYNLHCALDKVLSWLSKHNCMLIYLLAKQLTEIDSVHDILIYKLNLQSSEWNMTDIVFDCCERTNFICLMESFQISLRTTIFTNMKNLLWAI